MRAWDEIARILGFRNPKMTQRAADADRLARVYRVDRQRLIEVGQVYDAEVNAGIFTGTFEHYLAVYFVSRFNRGYYQTPPG